MLYTDGTASTLRWHKYIARGTLIKYVDKVEQFDGLVQETRN